MKRVPMLVGLIVALVVGGVALADDVTEADKLLCYVGTATLCLADGECVTVPAWTINIPEFVEVDLEAKVIRTTEANHEKRQTSIAHVQRSSGLIMLHATQEDRALSVLIEERSGMVTMAVAGDGLGVVGFGACTVSK